MDTIIFASVKRWEGSLCQSAVDLLAFLALAKAFLPGRWPSNLAGLAGRDDQCGRDMSSISEPCESVLPLPL
jgi:hypothetical protein